MAKKRIKEKTTTDSYFKDILDETTMLEEGNDMEELPVLEVKEEVVEKAVEKPIPTEVVEIVKYEPILMIEEVAQEFEDYKPYYLDALISFCMSRGFPVRGHKATLETTINAFGWHKKSEKSRRYRK